MKPRTITIQCPECDEDIVCDTEYADDGCIEAIVPDNCFSCGECLLDDVGVGETNFPEDWARGT